ncbi:hypothetical protein P280DRAFT_469768 [Massarina eburnea CBS 473.64]|uniref:Uncharacterized protein n=1 Tax=Massarina eburnea CBS 473.64 TaxID=1395130 RepID=A0A6A6RXH9_9PLEO|nr:hypothetical protein P280DRAFT_469768 [Massarina eburnea CBS 473.64]
MSTPQELTTTVSGRRCTRSRARTAATSSTTSSAPPPPPPPVTTSSQSTTSTTSQAAPQIQTSAPPPPPPPPASSTSTSTSTTQAAPPAAASSTTGTNSAVSSPQAQSVKAAAVPSAPAAAAAAPNVASSVPAAAASEADAASQTASVAAQAITTSAPAPAPAPAPATSASAPASAPDPATSDPASAISAPAPAPTTSAPVPTTTTSAATSSNTIVTAAPSSSTLLDSVLSSTSAAAVPDTTVPSAIPSDSSSTGQAQSTVTGISSGSTAGAIGSDHGTSGDGNGLTLPATGQTNVAGIAGGVVGGVVGIALISVLLFLCLRRRKTGTSEKGAEDQGSMSGFKGKVSLFFAKMKGKKSGPASNPYRRHTLRSSVSSVYSVQGLGRRSQSISEPADFGQQYRGIGDRMPSLNRSRTLLHKQDSLDIGVASSNVDDPFKDPADQPRNPFLLSPDQQPRDGPRTPKPTATTERASRDTFASIVGQLDKHDGSGTPDWLRDNVQKHKRMTSTQTALHSNPPANYALSDHTASVYSDDDNPFFDPSDIPLAPPLQPLPPNPPSRPANAYAPMPAFNATTNTNSRESDVSFFGEPGPSRPTTNMFGNKVRQSDPFDLDRPEVLSFGDVGGRTIRASTVTRQISKKGGNTVPNWVNVNDGPYDRTSAMPTPLARNPSTRR